MRVLYPTQAASRWERFGAYEMNVCMDAPVEGHGLGLVVVSHGGKSTGLTYRGLACHLAEAGYVVALPEHIGDCRSDSSLSGKAVNLENRPRQIESAIDWALSDAVLGSRICADDIAVVGHSMGGYTGLAVAGGQPSLGPHEAILDIHRDRRVRAVILMAPACAWFWKPGSLSGIDVPMLLMIAERDEMGEKLHVEYIERDCNPTLIERHLVAGAGHHAFQSPFPAIMNRADFPPSRDPEGFHRQTFQAVLYQTIEAFLKKRLRARGTGIDGAVER